MRARTRSHCLIDRPLSQPNFRSAKTMNDDACHISIVHAGDNRGGPNELDLVRAKN